MDRERAETYLRLLAEAELRRAMEMPAGSNRWRWHSATPALVAQALITVGAVGADVADRIQADVSVAVAGRRRLSARNLGPGRVWPAPRRASWRVVPVGQMITIGNDQVRGELLVVAYAQSAGGARFLVAGEPFRPFIAAVDDRGARYLIMWKFGRAGCEALLRPDPPHQVRWVDLTTAAGELATRIDLDPPNRAPVPDVTVTRTAHSPGELLLDVIAARILSLVAPGPRHSPGPPAAARAELRAFIGDGPGHIVAALDAAGALPPDSPVPGQLAGLCARIGIDGHGIAAPPAGDLPERWQTMLTPPRRSEPLAPPAPGILAATVAELPELDGAKIAIVGVHHGERGTFVHLLAAGVTREDEWPYGRVVRPLPVLWIRGSDGRWHTTHTQGVSEWRDSCMFTMWLRIVPPLDRGTAWIEISAAGTSAEARATLPLSTQ